MDLRDLLQGEHQGAAVGTSGSLENYLHETAGNTTIGVTVNGELDGAGTSSNLTIVLEGVTLAGADDASKIANLLASNKLVVDYDHFPVRPIRPRPGRTSAEAQGKQGTTCSKVQPLRKPS